MGFAIWVDFEQRVVWACGTHEYRPMGTAVIAITDQFRVRDFRQTRRVPARMHASFAGYFGTLEEVNARLRSAIVWREKMWRKRATPAHLL